MEPLFAGDASSVPPITPETIVVAAREQISSALGREAVILGLASGVYYGLNEVGNRVWDLIQMPQTVASVVSVLAAEFDVAPEVCERDVAALLHGMVRERLVEIVPHAPT